MIQILPFKRNPWESKVREYTEPEENWERSKRHFGHRYKKNFRQSREYK